jgi:hypothetical protein
VKAILAQRAASKDSERDAALKRLVRYDAVAVQNNGYDWGVEMVSADKGRFVEFDDIGPAMDAQQGVKGGAA